MFLARRSTVFRSVNSFIPSHNSNANTATHFFNKIINPSKLISNNLTKPILFNFRSFSNKNPNNNKQPHTPAHNTNPTQQQQQQQQHDDHPSHAHKSRSTAPHPIHPDGDNKIHETHHHEAAESVDEKVQNVSKFEVDFLSDDLDDDRLAHLFSNNRIWADSVERSYPGFFNRLSSQQTPKYLWIGCSDSRVPASEITGLMPGEVFVHRNVANCVLHSDFNVQAVIQIAVDVLRVEHIIVCGHYQCAGISLALDNKQIGLADHWVRNIKDVAVRHNKTLQSAGSLRNKQEMLVDLNVKQSVQNVCISSTVQNAWARGQKVVVHGWVYSIHNGLLKDLVSPPISSIKQVNQIFHFEPPKDNSNNTSQI